jgi:hypothetical protein
MSSVLSSLLNRLVLTAFLYATLLPSWSWAMENALSSSSKSIVSARMETVEASPMIQEVNDWRGILTHLVSQLPPERLSSEATLPVASSNTVFTLPIDPAFLALRDIFTNTNITNTADTNFTWSLSEHAYEVNFSKGLIFDSTRYEYASSLFYAGLVARYGVRGFQKNSEQAFKWYDRSAKRGQTTSAHSLGEMYEKGEGCEKDLFKAAQNYHLAGAVASPKLKALITTLKAAPVTDIAAQISLAQCYENGVGVSKDLYQAAQLYQSSAKANHTGARENLTRIVARLNTETDGDSKFALARAYQTGVLSDVTQNNIVDNAKALINYRLAITANHPDAQENLDAFVAKFKEEANDDTTGNKFNALGAWYHNGIGLIRNHLEAKAWYGKAIDLNNSYGYSNTGLLFEQGLGVKVDLFQALKHYYEAKTRNHPGIQEKIDRVVAKLDNLGENAASTQYLKAQCYENGVGQDLFKAAHYYQSSGVLGAENLIAVMQKLRSAPVTDSASQISLAQCYEKGVGVAKNITVAIQLYIKSNTLQSAFESLRRIKTSLAASDVQGQERYKIGLLIEEAKDLREAKEWFLLAATAGSAAAQYKIGTYAQQGLGTVPRDEQIAFDWYKKSANQSYVHGEYELARCFSSGFGTTKDETQARLYYERAAHKEHAEAMYNFGRYLEQGMGGSKNFQEAVNWYDKAVRKGSASAQIVIGNLLEKDRIAIDNGTFLTENIEHESRFKRIVRFLNLDTNKTETLKENKKFPNFYPHADGVYQAVHYYGMAAEQGNAEGLKRLTAVLEKLKIKDLRENNYSAYILSVYYDLRIKNSAYANFAIDWMEKAIRYQPEEISLENRNNLGLLYANKELKEYDARKAAEYFSKAADRGSEKAKNNLEILIQELQNEASVNNAKAQFNLAFCYAKEYGVAHNKVKVLELLEKAASNGLSDALYMLGCLYANGYHGAKDFDKAVEWLKKGEEKNNADAQNALGSFYENGYFYEKNLVEAFRYYEKAAKQKHSQGQSNLNRLIRKVSGGAYEGKKEFQLLLGILHEAGVGYKADKEQAIKWFKRAAAQGCAVAQNNLDRLQGVNTSRVAQFLQTESTLGKEEVVDTFNTYMTILQQSAQEGKAFDQNILGDCYSSGHGVAQNDETAYLWYEKAAAQGNADAINSLGVFYENGRHVPANRLEALKFYDKAQTQKHQLGTANFKRLVGSIIGSAKASKTSDQFVIAVMHVTGLGVPQDYVLALNYFAKALSKNKGEIPSSYEDMAKVFQIAIANNDTESSLYAPAFMDALKSLAALKNPKACRALAYCYDHGILVDQNSETALAFYQTAEQLKDTVAEQTLIDKRKSLEAEARKGDAESQYLLSIIYEKGLGGKPHPKESKRWALQASNRGHEKAADQVGAYDIKATKMKDVQLSNVAFPPHQLKRKKDLSDFLKQLKQASSAGEAIISDFLIDTDNQLFSNNIKSIFPFKLPRENSPTTVQFWDEVESIPVADRGMKWSAYGLDFVLAQNGTLTLFASDQKDTYNVDTLRIHNPYGDIVVQSTHELKHLQLSGRNVFYEGQKSTIERLDIWAYGKQTKAGFTRGTSVMSANAHLLVQELYQHQGFFEQKGTLSSANNLKLVLSEGGVNNGAISSNKEMHFTTDAQFTNNKTIQSHTLTLGGAGDIINEDEIAATFIKGVLQGLTNAKQAVIKATEGFQNWYIQNFTNDGQISGNGGIRVKKGVNHGLLNAEKSLSITVDALFHNAEEATINASDSILFKGTGSVDQEGQILTPVLNIASHSFVVRGVQKELTDHIILGENNAVFEIAKDMECSIGKLVAEKNTAAQIINYGNSTIAALDSNRALHNYKTLNIDHIRQKDGLIYNDKKAEFFVHETATLENINFNNDGITHFYKTLEVIHSQIANKNKFIVHGEAILAAANLDNTSLLTFEKTVSGTIASLINKATGTLTFAKLLQLKGLIDQKTRSFFHNFGRLITKAKVTLEKIDILNANDMLLSGFFSSTGTQFKTTASSKIVAGESFKVDTQNPLTLDGRFTAATDVTLTAPQINNTSVFAQKDGRAIFNGRLSNYHSMRTNIFVNDADILENNGTFDTNCHEQYLFTGDYSKFPLLRHHQIIRNAHNASFTVRSGGFYAQTIENHGNMSLLNGYYGVRNWDNENGTASIDHFFITRPAALLAGILDVTHLLPSVKPYVHLRVTGTMTIHEGGFKAKLLENEGTLRLQKGMHDIDTLANVKDAAQLFLYQAAHLSVNDINNNGDIISIEDLALDTLSNVQKLGIIKTVKNLLIRSSNNQSPLLGADAPNQIVSKQKVEGRNDAWLSNFLQTNSPNLFMGAKFFVEANQFVNLIDLYVPHFIRFKTEKFSNQHTLKTHGLDIQSGEMANGLSDTTKGTIHSYGPLTAVVKRDINNSVGEIKATETIHLKSLTGKIDNGAAIVEGKKKRRNGANIVSNTMLILETLDGDIDHDYGVSYGILGVEYRFHGHKLSNITAQILGGGPITLEGKELRNQMGGFYSQHTPRNVHEEGGSSNGGGFFGSSSGWSSDYTVTDSVQYSISGGSEIHTTNGDIRLNVSRGTNKGSSIATPNRLYINGDILNPEDEIPSCFAHEAVVLHSSTFGPKAGEPDNMFGGGGFGRVFGGYSEKQTGITETFPAHLKGGKNVVIDMGLFILSGSATAGERFTLNVERMEALGLDIYQDAQTGDAFIDLGAVIRKHMETSALFEKNPHLTQASTEPSSEPAARRNQTPMITVGLTRDLPYKFSPDILYQMQQDSMPRPYLSSEALHHAILISLRDFVHSVNLCGVSIEDLVDVKFARGHANMQRLIEGGHSLNDILAIRKAFAGSENSIAFYNEPQEINGELTLVPIMFIPQALMLQEAKKVCGISGATVDLNLGSTPSGLASRSEGCDVSSKDTKKILDDKDVLSLHASRQKALGKSAVDDEALADLRKLTTDNEALKSGGTRFWSKSDLAIRGGDFTSDSFIRTHSDGILSLHSKSKNVQTSQGNMDVPILLKMDAKGSIVNTSSRLLHIMGAVMSGAADEHSEFAVRNEAPAVIDEALEQMEMRQYVQGHHDGDIDVTEHFSRPLTSIYVAKKDQNGNQAPLFFNSTHGPLIMAAPHFDAAITKLRGHGIKLLDVHNQHSRQTKQHVDGGTFGNDKYIQTMYMSSISRGPSSSGDLEFESLGGDVEVTNIRCGKITASIYDGVMKIFLGVNSESYVRMEKEKSIVWKSQRVDGHESKTYSESEFKELIMKTPSDVHVQQVRGKTTELLNKIHLNGGHITQEFLDEVYKETHDKVEGPTAALAIIVAIAITIATYGAGAYLGGAAAGASGTTTAATTAGFATAEAATASITAAQTAVGSTVLSGSALSGAAFGSGITAGVTGTAATGFAATTLSYSAGGMMIAGMGQAAAASLFASGGLALLNAKGDLDKAARNFASMQTVKNLGVAVATAGLTQTLAPQFGVDTNISGFSNAKLSMGTQITKHLGYQAFQAGIGATLDIAMGQKPSAVLESRLKFAGIQTVSGFCAGQVGSWYDTADINGLVHKTLTAVTGAASGFLMNGERGALPSAIGALAAASFADWYLSADEIKAQMDTHPLHEVQEHIRTSTEVSRMMAAVVCGLMRMSDEETEEAMRAAGTTLDNDYMASALKTVEEIKVARAKKATEELKLAQEEAAREEKAKFEQEKRAKEQAARATALKKLAQEKKARDKQASREAAQAKAEAEAQRTSAKAGSNSAAQTQTAASTAGPSTTSQSDASAEKVIPHTMNGQTIYLQCTEAEYEKYKTSYQAWEQVDKRLELEIKAAKHSNPIKARDLESQCELHKIKRPTTPLRALGKWSDGAVKENLKKVGNAAGQVLHDVNESHKVDWEQLKKDPLNARNILKAPVTLTNEALKRGIKIVGAVVEPVVDKATSLGRQALREAGVSTQVASDIVFVAEKIADVVNVGKMTRSLISTARNAPKSVVKTAVQSTKNAANQTSKSAVDCSKSMSAAPKYTPAPTDVSQIGRGGGRGLNMKAPANNVSQGKVMTTNPMHNVSFGGTAGVKVTQGNVFKAPANTPSMTPLANKSTGTHGAWSSVNAQMPANNVGGISNPFSSKTPFAVIQGGMGSRMAAEMSAGGHAGNAAGVSSYANVARGAGATAAADASKLSNASATAKDVERISAAVESKVKNIHLDELPGHSRVSNRTQLFGTDEIAEFSAQRVGATNGRMRINSDYAGKVYKFDEAYLKNALSNTMKTNDEVLINQWLSDFRSQRIDALPREVLDKINDIRILQNKYPNGASFNGEGFIDLTPYAIKKVKIEITGDHPTDFRRANKVAGYKKTPKEMTWHHHEDTNTMLLVPKDLHDAVRHTGGVAVLKEKGTI